MEHGMEREEAEGPDRERFHWFNARPHRAFYTRYGTSRTLAYLQRAALFLCWYIVYCLVWCFLDRCLFLLGGFGSFFV